MATATLRGSIFVLLVWCWTLPAPAQARPVTLKGFSTAALVKCFSDYKCGETYWAVSSELARRRPTRFLIKSFWKTRNPAERSGIILALYQIDSPEVARFMRTAVDRKTVIDDDLFYANDYLGQRCDPRALRFLSGSGTKKYYQLAACPDWARTVSYFGKCRYRPAASFLVNSLETQCLDIGNAAVVSLHELFPDAPKRFASREAMKDYFSKRIAASR